MTIKEQYDILLDKEYKFSLLNEINELKEQCVLENNTEYMYKCDLLISDIYIEHQNYNEALNILLKDIKLVDEIVFKNVYIDLLDRLIYLYITKRNYNIALRYISEKEKNIDLNDNDTLNRLYLEYSYVYGDMGDLNKSKEYLLKLLDNNPSYELKSVALSNITKIYVDEKNIDLSKKYLNECIMYANDHESEIYNDYLLAKISVLEGNTKQALMLYDSIFTNEEINSMTLSMMNDYLKLLNSLKKYNKSLLLMNKLSLFINATSDLVVINNFYKNKLEYFIGIKDNVNITVTMKEIEGIEKQINANEQAILNENIEDDKKDIKEKTQEEAFKKVDLLTSLVDTALKGNTLREIIMDFSSKVQKIIGFDELQFVLFNYVNEKEYQISNEINCYKFKNNKLYEKNIPYENIKGSIIELMINKNKPITIDFNELNFEIKDLFSNNLYNKDEYKYLNVIPCLYKDDTFAAVIYSSKTNDLTDHSNYILLKVATKLLESSLIIQFIEENVKSLENSNSFIINENNIGMFHLNNNTLYISDNLKQLLELKRNTISVETYCKKIIKADLNKYLDHLSTNTKSNIKYRYELNDKTIELLEIIEPVTNLNGKILYYQGMIKSLETESIGYALSERDLNEKLNHLKKKQNLIEFKFSIIKIKGNVDEYQNIKNSFGVEPYYLNDGTFIIILENEVNQRTLDKLVKEYNTRCSIIRYPRDIINIDEMLEVVSLMIERSKLYFSNDIYREYVKKNNLINRLDSILEKDFSLISLNFDCFDKEKFYEIKPNLFGFDEKEAIHKLLNGSLLNKYENKFLDTFMKNKFNEKCFINLSNDSIYKLFTEYNYNDFKNITAVMREFNKITPVIIDKLKSYNMKIFIDYSLINKLDAYYFTTGIITGIYVDNSVNVDGNKLFRLLSMFDLRLICYNNVFDYNKVCYYDNKKELIK